MTFDTDIDRKARKVFGINGFHGADFSSSPLDADSSRMAQGKNWISENGTLHKRHGWEQILQFPQENNRDVEIHGIYHYETDTYVHAGTYLYRITYTAISGLSTYEGATANLVGSLSGSTITGAGMADKDSQWYQQGDYAYIVCNMIFQLKPYCKLTATEKATYPNGILVDLVSDHIEQSVGARIETTHGAAYVPTTTISINESHTDDAVRASLDDANLATFWRKNSLLGQPSTFAHTNVRTWVLDGKMLLTSTIHSRVTVTIEGKNGDSAVFATQFNYGTSAYRPLLKISGTATSQDSTSIANNTVVGYIVPDNGAGVSSLVLVKGSNELPYMEYTYTVAGLAWESTEPAVEGMDNIIVEFCDDPGEGNRFNEFAQYLSASTLFGVNGNRDRLFITDGIAGQPSTLLDKDDWTCNVEYWSAAGDFTYFPDLNYSELGTTRTKIIGYSLLSDETQIIYVNDDIEASFYYRTGSYQYQYDSSGNITKMTAVFPTKAGALGETAISRQCIGRFGNDNVFLSQHGLFTLSLTDNVSSDERYALNRSVYINASLTAQDGLDEACGYYYGDKYYIAVNGVCYVADYARKTTPTDRTEYSYEWYYWTNIPARVFGQIDGKLAFGTADGKVCIFGDGYKDVTFYDTTSGQLSYATNDESYKEYWLTFDITLTTQLNKMVGARFITTPPRQAIYSGESTWQTTLSSGTALVADFNKPKIESVKDESISGTLTLVRDRTVPHSTLYAYTLWSTDTTPVQYMTGTYHLSLPADYGYQDFIIDDDALTMKLGTGNNDGGMIPSDLVTNPCLRLRFESNVVAEWITPFIDFGSRYYLKTLERMTITAEPATEQRFLFGYITRAAADVAKARKEGVFAFTQDANVFTFQNGFADSYTVKIVARNINFLQVWIRSDSDTDCAPNSLQIIYKLNTQGKGLR